FFQTVNVSEKIAKISLQIKNDLKNIAEIITSDKPPDTKPGKFCGKPFNCPMKKKCWSSVLNTSILHLYSLTNKLERKLSESGVEAIGDIPLDFPGLTEKQKIQIENTR